MKQLEKITNSSFAESLCEKMCMKKYLVFRTPLKKVMTSSSTLNNRKTNKKFQIWSSSKLRMHYETSTKNIRGLYSGYHVKPSSPVTEIPHCL